jgi:cell division protein FtsB
VATDPLLSIAEELYGLPPGEFTGTRNAWAKQTKADGDPELAKRVGELRKPSLPAWVVNMMMRHQGEEMAQVLDLGASLRQAQADLDGDALRELTRQRRQLTTAVTHSGRVLAGQLGQKVTEAVADQVQATLHAAMVDQDAAAAVRSGMLVGALVATGVGSADVVDAVALPAAIGMTARPRSRTSPAAAAPVPERPDLSVVPGPEPTPDEEQRARKADLEARRRAAQEAVDTALAAADEAQRRLRKTHKRVTRVQAHTLQTADELDQARRRVAELEHELEGLDEEAGAAQEKRARAEQRYAEAQEALERAQGALAEVDGSG